MNTISIGYSASNDNYKSNGKHAYGLIAEKVNELLLTIVLHHPETKEIESVDYIQLIPILLKLYKINKNNWINTKKCFRNYIKFYIIIIKII